MLDCFLKVSLCGWDLGVSMVIALYDIVLIYILQLIQAVAELVQ